jgi:peptidoglycan/LPS O-acetylase OafA/YrhL
MYLTPAVLLEHLGLRYTGGYEPDWRFSFAFLENYRMILAHQGPKLGPLLVTWSLCIEEHFYIIWAIVISVTSLRIIPYAMMVLVCMGISARILAAHLLPGYDISTSEIFTSLDYFACGGIVGYMAAVQRQYLDNIVAAIPSYLQWTYLFFIIVYVFAHDDMLAWAHVSPYVRDTVHSILFAALIALVIPDSSPIRIGPNNVFSYLGRISYGLYLFHLPVILVWLTVCNRHHITIDSPLSIFLSFIGIFSISVVLASVLYFYFEKPILKLKRYL